MKRLNEEQLIEKTGSMINLFDKLISEAEISDDKRTAAVIRDEHRSVILGMKGLFLHSAWATVFLNECEDFEAFIKSKWRTPNWNFRKEYLAGHRNILLSFRDQCSMVL